MLAGLATQASKAEEPTFSHSFRYNVFDVMNDEGLLARAGLEYDYDLPFPYPETGNAEIRRTTGAPWEFDPTRGEVVVETPPLAVTRENLREVDFNNDGSLLVEFYNIGPTDVGETVKDKVVALYKDGEFTTPLGPKWADDARINNNGTIAATQFFEYGHGGYPGGTPVPVIVSPGGSVQEIPHPKGEQWGYELSPDGPHSERRSNSGRAIAINDSNTVLCSSSYWYSDQFFIGHLQTSFLYRNGTIIQELPSGASALNNRGEVVGVDTVADTENFWIYLPAARYGLSAGVNYVIWEEDARLTSYNKFKISDDGMIAMLDSKKIWIEGTRYDDVSSLVQASEDFTIDWIIDINARGQILVRTTEEEGYNYSRILTPSAPKAIVNSTSDNPLGADSTGSETGELLSDGKPETTLRSAIQAVNLGRASAIEFAIPEDALPENGIPVIAPATNLPELNAQVKIDGTTQSAGWVEIRGNPSLDHGLSLVGGLSEVRGLVINRFSKENAACIKLSGLNGNKIVGNRIGLDADGLVSHDDFRGILIADSSENTIGGTLPQDGNLIFGDASCISIRGEASTDNSIIGNRINLKENGTQLDAEIGIDLESGTGTRIGGNEEGEGNIIGVGNNKIAVFGASPSLQAIKIIGNRIGLDEGGTVSESGTFGIILGNGQPSAPLRDFEVTNNLIAGVKNGIWLIGCTEPKVSENQVGFAFDDSGNLPSGANPNLLQQGIRLDKCPGAEITKNKVGGYQWNILASGGTRFSIDSSTPGNILFTFYYATDGHLDPVHQVATEGLLIEENEVGTFNGIAPANSAQKHGISIFYHLGETQTLNNTVAGHGTTEILVVSGKDHVLEGNKVGAIDDTDYGSKTGITISNAADTRIGSVANPNHVGFNELGGIAIIADSKGTIVRGNLIGVPVGLGEPRPNANGIAVVSGENASPSDTLIESNEIVGSVGRGILLSNAGSVMVRDNWIGVTRGGQKLPNQTGIGVVSTPAIIKNNTIAENAEGGIVVAGHDENSRVLIETNTIYGNGDPEQTNAGGIRYQSNPIPPPKKLISLGSAEPIDGNFVFFFIVPSFGIEETVIIEVFGNEQGDSSPQGKYPLVRKPVYGGAAGLVSFEAPVEAITGRTFHFRATATIAGATSQFSDQSATIPFEVPELTIRPPQSGAVTMLWDANPFFAPQVTEDLRSDWTDVEATIQESAGQNFVEFPLAEDTAYFFRLGINAATVLSSLP